MKQDLINIITKLEADPRFAISVVNLQANKRVILNASNDDLKAGYGSAKQFFEKLYQDGIKRIRVCPRVQNGTQSGTNGAVKNYARSVDMPEFDFEFEPKQETQTAVIPQNAPMMQPLNGGMYGDMSNIFKIQHYDVLKDDYARVKAERNQLRETNQELKRTIFEQETLGVKAIEKSKAQKELLEAGQGYAPMIIEVLRGLKPTPVDAVGLGAGLSPIKQSFMQADDAFLTELKVVADCYEKAGFEEELNLLLNKYKS